MKIVMTLLVRDEEDIVGEQLRFHLEQGIVDFVIATDHRSVDGTTDILREYERQGCLHLIREERQEYLQPLYVTRMARLAATDFGADWVINADADEFWWPREAPLHETLAAVPPRFGCVVGFWRHFVLRPDDDRPFYERMIWRRRPTLEWTNPYHAAIKVAHRADPEVEVMGGNHKAYGRGLAVLREWIPIEVLHFPIRTRAHMERKFRTAGIGSHRPGRHWVRAVREIASGGADRMHTSLLVDDAALAAGLAAGRLTEDVRVRDVLRRDGGALGSVPAAGLDEDAAFAAEVGAFHPADSTTRLWWRGQELRRRGEGIDAVLSLRSGNGEAIAGDAPDRA